ncbi:MAG: hypothetical protein PHD81_01055 [Candidatus Nanoarchaeia archaeon]|nr:hypothetical protein [Candidatus Nanoarchaeia archaeon]MDD5587679.1 hypothetical protein [Candidatus Nanoarchaeia archaeon]
MNQVIELERRIEALSKKVYELDWNNHLRHKGELLYNEHPQTWKEAVERGRVLWDEMWYCFYDLFEAVKDKPRDYMNVQQEELLALTVLLRFYVGHSQEPPKNPRGTPDKDKKPIYLN